MSPSKKIIFVDDEADFHIISRIKFSEEINSGEFEIQCFDNPCEALEFLKIHGEGIDIVFTDLKMGKLDGFQLIEQIHQSFPNLPCYVISAFDSDRTRQRAEQLKTHGYMQKPIDYQEIKKVILSLPT
jgi:DNA-binding NtrC family response regulator